MEEHVEHLWKVFQRLRENKLYAKFEKCKFGMTEVDFLGHRITPKGLKMDDHKVKAILDWEPPRSILALRSFLGLASYYHKFIKNFAKIATPLTNLLKKSSGIYEWDKVCNDAFKTLKGILVKAHVLKLLDFDKDFEIHFDAFHFAIRGILVQDGRPVAFESKKLSKMKRRWGKGNVGHDTLFQDLGPLHRFQRCGGVDRQCHLEILYHSTKIVIKTSEMARHVGLVQCGHST
jgi:hypothetical protein